MLALGGTAAAQTPSREPVFRASGKPLISQTAAVDPVQVPKAKDFIAPAAPEEPLSSTDAIINEYKKLLDPPSSDALFGRLDSERTLEERIRQQALQRNPPDSTVKFPTNPPISRAEFKQREFPAQTMIAEPRFVCHQRLYFEEKNAERYGWDLGFIQPFVSTLYFYKDVVFLPHNFLSHPCRRYECSTGYCLPGDPVPYILYPPEFTLTGSIAEVGMIALLIAIFP